MKYAQLLSILLTVLVLASCKKEEIEPEPDPQIDPPVQYVTDVLSAGKNDQGEAAYWINDSMIVLTSGTPGVAFGVGAKSDGSVHVCVNSNNQIKYYINDVETSLQSMGFGTSGRKMHVINSDVYIAGADENASSIDVATYWLNGVPEYLTDGTLNASVNDVTVIGGDVYAIGYENNMPKLWINGTSSDLTTSSSVAIPTGIVELNGAYIITGYEKNTTTNLFQVVAWENGSPNILTSQNDDCYANDIDVQNGSYLIGGTHDTNGGTIWDVTGNVTTLAPFGEILGVHSYSGSLYACGSDDNNAIIWKDGIPDTLELGVNGTPYIEDVFVHYH